jgi:hypothetical protein
LIHDKSRGNLAHYEEEGYGGDGEEEVFPLETHGNSSKAVCHGPSAAAPQDIKNATGSIVQSLFLCTGPPQMEVVYSLF